MVGQLLYELFTHGCHPYTELYGHSLDRVLELVRYILVSLICFLGNKAGMNLCIPLNKIETIVVDTIFKIKNRFNRSLDFRLDISI